MILHFVTDEIFTDYAIKQFSHPDLMSDFICVNTSGNLKLVKLRDTIRVVDHKSKELYALLDDLGKYNAIVLHGMHWAEWQQPILEKVPPHVKVAWVLWGGDIYGRHDVNDNFLAPLSFVIDRSRNWYKRLTKSVNTDTSWEIPLSLYRRVDYCLTSQLEEYDYAVKFTGVNYKHLWYTYFSIDEMIGELKEKRCKGNGVWLGHCATITSNFYEALLLMRFSKHHIEHDQKIIIPLSYGFPWVSIKIRRFAKFLFGERAHVLLEWMQRKDYYALMLQCSTMIMPSYQSQGIGNIITGLWLGMRVYVSKRNISFGFFRRIGLKIFSYEDDFSKYGYKPLEDEYVEHNRRILSEFYSSEHIKDAVKTIVKTLDTK